MTLATQNITMNQNLPPGHPAARQPPEFDHFVPAPSALLDDPAMGSFNWMLAAHDNPASCSAAADAGGSSGVPWLSVGDELFDDFNKLSDFLFDPSAPDLSFGPADVYDDGGGGGGGGSPSPGSPFSSAGGSPQPAAYATNMDVDMMASIYDEVAGGGAEHSLHAAHQHMGSPPPHGHNAHHGLLSFAAPQQQVYASSPPASPKSPSAYAASPPPPHYQQQQHYAMHPMSPGHAGATAYQHHQPAMASHHHQQHHHHHHHGSGGASLHYHPPPHGGSGGSSKASSSSSSAARRKSSSSATSEAPEPSHPKPPFSFPCLIGLAMSSSETGKMAVSQIYSYITTRFPYFRTAKSGWKNSIRHNLSLNKFFVKVEREDGETGKGSLWAVNDSLKEQLDRDIRNCEQRNPLKLRLSQETLDISQLSPPSAAQQHGSGASGTSPSSAAGTPYHQQQQDHHQSTPHSTRYSHRVERRRSRAQRDLSGSFASMMEG